MGPLLSHILNTPLAEHENKRIMHPFQAAFTVTLQSCTVPVVFAGRMLERRQHNRPTAGVTYANKPRSHSVIYMHTCCCR